MNDFLSDPRPERYERLDGGDQRLALTVGLARITHDRRGLEVLPHVTPMLAMTLGESEEKFDLPVKWARELAHKILEWCDTAEKMNGS